jgi:hypothetical protein
MSHTLHETQSREEKKPVESRSVPLIGRGTIADYGMLCDVLRGCYAASSPLHLDDRRETLYFRDKAEPRLD